MPRSGIMDLMGGDIAYRNVVSCLRPGTDVLFNWTPNFIEALYEGKFIEFPEFEWACRDDPAWEMNKEFTHGCGIPRAGYLTIGVWEGMSDMWPVAMAVLKSINFTNLDVAIMAKLFDADGMEPVDAADVWLADNEGRWRSWLPGTT